MHKHRLDHAASCTHVSGSHAQELCFHPQSQLDPLTLVLQDAMEGVGVAENLLSYFSAAVAAGAAPVAVEDAQFLGGLAIYPGIGLSTQQLQVC